MLIVGTLVGLGSGCDELGHPQSQSSCFDILGDRSTVVRALGHECVEHLHRSSGRSEPPHTPQQQRRASPAPPFHSELAAATWSNLGNDSQQGPSFCLSFVLLLFVVVHVVLLVVLVAHRVVEGCGGAEHSPSKGAGMKIIGSLSRRRGDCFHTASGNYS
jgi:hypothetical protein